MIYYSQIEDKDADHPLVKEFEAQCKAEDEMYAACGPVFLSLGQTNMKRRTQRMKHILSKGV